jgi:voltage-gated potassium channel Kch
MAVMMSLVGIVLILVMLLDAFETMLLPRRVKRQFRLARLYYLHSWTPWAALAGLIRSGKRRHTFLSVFGPLSILGLISLWATGLIIGFGLLHWGLGTPLAGKEEGVGLGYYAYFSGVTFFTLGYGDLTPSEPTGRILAVVETGIGFGFLALVISYLPVLYQAFSRREVTISLLDARAGSPPTAGTLLVRIARFSDLGRLDHFLGEWEHWAAQVLESHISFPVLSYYRSQHDNQSWLAALTAILDTSALVLAALPKTDRSQAWMAFAMGRHVVVDLAQVFDAPPVDPPTDRLPPGLWNTLRKRLEQAGMTLDDGEDVQRRLLELRGMYEPFVHALSLRFRLPLPPVVPDREPVDNWQTSAWMRRARGFGQLTGSETADDHDD